MAGGVYRTCCLCATPPARRRDRMSHPLVTVIGTPLITALVLAVLAGLAAAAVIMSRGPRTALGLALPVPPGSRPFFGRPSLPKRWELMPRIAAIDRTSATPAASAHQDPQKRGGPLERITVNLVLRAARALQNGVGSHGRQQDRLHQPGYPGLRLPSGDRLSGGSRLRPRGQGFRASASEDPLAPSSGSFGAPSSELAAWKGPGSCHRAAFLGPSMVYLFVSHIRARTRAARSGSARREADRGRPAGAVPAVLVAREPLRAVPPRHGYPARPHRRLMTTADGPAGVVNQGALPPRPGHEPLSEQRIATSGGNTRAPARRPGRRTGLSICVLGGLRRERDSGICGGPGLAGHDCPGVRPQ